MKRAVCIVLLVLAFISQTVRSAPPRMINYQGKLTNSSGTPLIGTYEITFRLYSSWVGGTPLWSDILTVNSDSNGVFSTILGTPNPLSPSHFNGDERYLSLQVTGSSEQTPRTLLTFAPMAFHAIESESAISAPNYLPLAGGTMTGPTIHNSTTSRWQVGGSDKIVINPSQASNNSIVLPDSAVSAAEILNEPGIAASYTTATTALDCSAVSNILALTITIPGPGYIVVDANGTVLSATSSTGFIGGAVGIAETASSSVVSPYRVRFEMQMSASGYNYIVYPFGTHRVFYKSSPGSYTFYLNGTRYGNCGTSWTAEVKESMMKATFYPTSYGPTATLVAADHVGDFESAEAVTVFPNPHDSTRTETMYKVDLRELELKAAREQAESERAQRELAEAKLNAQRVGTARE